MGSEERPRLLLIDAYALIYRAHFAFSRRPLTNAAGENTSAPFGFAGFLRDLLRDRRPTHAAVVFDAGVSFRDELYPAYKATRDRMPADLRSSLRYCRAIVRGFSLALVELEGYEADDVIGTLVRQAGEEGVETMIVSGDKDFCQLVGPRVALLNPGRGGVAGVRPEVMDAAATKNRFGVAPRQIADYLALVGDASDNVPGAPGIGPKTAVKLLAVHANLDEIIARADELKPPRLGRIVREHADLVRLSKELVTIKCDLDIALDMEALAVGEPDAAALRDVFGHLEFRHLAEEYGKLADRSGDPAKELPATEPRPPRIVTRFAELPELVRSASKAGRLAIHTETRARGAGSSRIVGLGLAIDDDNAWYLPLGHESFTLTELEADEAGELPNLPSLEDPAMAPLRELLASDVPKFGHDLKRHAAALSSSVPLGGEWFDVMIASYLLDPGRRDHGPSQLALAELGERHPVETDVTGSGRSRRGFAEVGVRELGAYCAARARLALRLGDRFRRRLANAGLDDLMFEMEMPLAPILLGMERRGIGLDREFFAEMRSRIVLELKTLRNEVFSLAGGPFNMNSTPQLRRVLFDQLGMPVLKKTKTGASTDASVLEELAVLGHELPRRMLAYRELEKLRSTYVEALPTLADPATGRVHTSFNQAVAATGRLSSSNPNLQNIPIRTEIGREIRHGFVAPPGHLFLSADYSQIELRVLAHLSEDESFLAAFRGGVDIHRQTAALIFAVALEEVTPEMRYRAKTVNFATLYGQGAFALARQLGITRAEAQAFIDSYFEKLGGIRAYLDEQVEMARRQGYVETLMGRRRTVPELKSPNWNVRQAGERIARNTPIQGSAADLMKKAMIDVQQALDGAGSEAAMLLQVHDELLLEAPTDELEAVSELVVGRMESAATLKVPLVVDSGAGRDWYECKG